MLLHVGMLRVRTQGGGHQRYRPRLVRLVLALLRLGAAATHEVRKRRTPVLLHLRDGCTNT